MELRFITFILSIFFCLNATAFTLNNTAGAAFEKDEVSVNVSNAGCTNISTTPAELLDLAEAAVNRFWNTVPTSFLTLKRGSLVSTAAAFATDQVCSSGSGGTCTPNANLKVASDILIVCNTNATNFSNSPSVLGVTVPNNISGKTINGALILINDNAASSFPSRDYDEKVAIIAHEIGHAIGLGHSKFGDQLMYFQSVPTRRLLGWDDEDGVSWLYPADQPVNVCNAVAFDENRWSYLFTVFLGMLLMMLSTLIKSGRKKF